MIYRKITNIQNPISCEIYFTDDDLDSGQMKNWSVQVTAARFYIPSFFWLKHHFMHQSGKK
jgi:hypothetical protein